MPNLLRKSRKGFNLSELVIVVIIIGIIAAIAIPKMSRGANSAAETALAADLQILRNALEMYQAEHNGTYPTASQIDAQLLGQTKVDGTVVSSAPIGIALYGPYLKTIPPLPVGTAIQRGGNTISTSPGKDVGWIYNAEAFTINANASGADSSGTPYASY